MGGNQQENGMMDNIKELLAYGRIGLETGYYEAARGYFEQVLALDSTNRGAKEALAKIEAILARKAIDDLLTSGDIALDRGWYEKAQNYYEQVLALDSGNREAREALAEIEAILAREAPLKLKPEIQPTAQKRQSRLRGPRGVFAPRFKLIHLGVYPI